MGQASDIGERYNVSLLTPKDWASHFKNILHRGMWTKGHDETDQECRCCRVAFENIQHWATCQSVQPIFRALARMMGVTVQWDDKRRAERFVLFLEVEGVKRQPAGWVNFHLVLWKYLINQFVLVELEEETFAPHEVWRATLDRFEKRAHAKQVSIQADILLADSRGEDPPDVSLKKNPLKPLGEFHPGTGAIEWDAKIIDSLTALATRPKPPPSRKGGAKTKPPHPPPHRRGGARGPPAPAAAVEGV